MKRFASSLSLAILLLSILVVRAEDRLVSLAGKSVTARIIAIDGDGNVTVAGSSKTTQLNALRSIDRPAQDVQTELNNGEAVAGLTLASGGSVVGWKLSLGDDEFTLQTTAGELTISIDDVRAVRFGAEGTHAVFTKALAQPEDEFDRFMTLVDDEMTTIRGFVESIDASNVQFEWDGESRSLPRSKAYAVVLAAAKDEAAAKPPCVVSLHNGSQLPGEVRSLKKAESGKLVLTIDLGASELALPWESVQSITIHSDRVRYVSDLEPVDVIESPIVALPRKWRKNRNVLGKPLRIGERTFSNGIGVQSRSVLTFDASAKYQRFTATIGIDAGTGGKGDCEFVVMGDGRELLRQRMRGTDDAKSIEVSIADVDKVQLMVEPGKDLDFGDHANWCDACFIR